MELYQMDCGCAWPIVGPPPTEGALPLLDVDDENLPFCKKTWDMLASGRTKGVFQLESNLGQSWCKRLKPTTAEHMGALGALLRPGCLRSIDERTQKSMTELYCLRKNGQAETFSYHPAVDPILAPTYGVLAFQEQAMMLAQAVAGFTLQDADVLRKAIGKKLAEEMAKVERMFMEGAKKAGVVSEEQAEEIFGWIEKSQRYSFNKSHAVSYGLTGYDTAYLKSHFPVQAFANWLYFAKDKADAQDEVADLVQEAKLFDVQVLTPDVRTLEPHFSTDGLVVRFGLSDIRGVGEAAVEKLRAIVADAEHEAGRKPYREFNWEDWLFFVLPRVSSTTAKGLIKAGAFAWTGKSRKRMENEYDSISLLTDREIAVLHAIHRGDRKSPVEPTEPRLDDEDWLAEAVDEWAGLTTRQKTSRKKALAKAYAGAREEFEAWVGHAGPFADVVAALRAVAAVGEVNVKRKEVIGSAADLLEHPPASEADHPNEIAWAEEHYLGVALTCSRVDAVDDTQANCTCRDFLAGRSGCLMLAVEVKAVREVTTKGGKNPGQKMAFLTVADSSCHLTDVCVFPSQWKAYSSVLHEGAIVLIEGERDQKKDSLIVNQAYPLG